jgi:hypothetical protein
MSNADVKAKIHHRTVRAQKLRLGDEMTSKHLRKKGKKKQHIA